MIESLLRVKFGILLILGTGLLLGLVVSQEALAGQAGAERDSDTAFAWSSLVKPLGVATLSSLCLTFLAGVFRRKLGRRFQTIHLVLAITSVTLGLSHGLLVLMLFG